VLAKGTDHAAAAGAKVIATATAAKLYRAAGRLAGSLKNKPQPHPSAAGAFKGDPLGSRP